jgi:hypothetical protein
VILGLTRPAPLDPTDFEDAIELDSCRPVRRLLLSFFEFHYY